jgi:hypothetical protein
MLSPLFAAERGFEIRALYPFSACLIGVLIPAVAHADWWLAGIALVAMLLNGAIGAGLEKNKAKRFQGDATGLESYEPTSCGNLSSSELRVLSHTGFKFTALVAAVVALITYSLKQSWWLMLVIPAAAYFVSSWWWYVVAVSRPQRRTLQSIEQGTGGKVIEALGWKRTGRVSGMQSPLPPSVTPISIPLSAQSKLNRSRKIFSMLLSVAANPELPKARRREFLHLAKAQHAIVSRRMRRIFHGGGSSTTNISEKRDGEH